MIEPIQRTGAVKYEEFDEIAESRWSNALARNWFPLVNFFVFFLFRPHRLVDPSMGSAEAAKSSSSAALLPRKYYSSSNHSTSGGHSSQMMRTANSSRYFFFTAKSFYRKSISYPSSLFLYGVVPVLRSHQPPTSFQIIRTEVIFHLDTHNFFWVPGRK